MSTLVSKAVLVDAPTQAGKTKKCFEVLADKIGCGSGVGVLFLTQANCIVSASQVLKRAIDSEVLTSCISKDNIWRGNTALTEDKVKNHGNYMLIDYWNSRNTNIMLLFLERRRKVFTDKPPPPTIIVIDEADQGGESGTTNRLMFVREVEKITSNVMVIFITATIAQLSKSILKVACADLPNLGKGVLYDIINDKVVEHQSAQIESHYIGASWFRDTPGVWRKLDLPKKSKKKSIEEHNQAKENVIMSAIKDLPDHAKELSLIVASTKMTDHEQIATRLFDAGFNVTVEMNSVEQNKFKVRYISDCGEIRTWGLAKDAVSLSHLLCAALFMKTEHEKRIKDHSHVAEFDVLERISSTIVRPKGYPHQPRVALVAGHLAGRGITIQNQLIDFTCTSFCFIDIKNNSSSRGASNAQRFGRACGLLGNVYLREGRQPLLLATVGTMRDAIANELVVTEKADNGSLICLKDMVTVDEWRDIIDRVKKADVDGDGDAEDPKSRMKTLLNLWWPNQTSIIGQIVRYMYQMGEGGVCEHDLKVYIEHAGSKNVDEMYRHLTRTNKDYGYVFTRTRDKMTKLRADARKYVKENHT